MLDPFRLISPSTVAEASSELIRLDDRAAVYAGGAELILLMRNGLLHPQLLVNIKSLPGMQTLAWDGQAVRIGATVTHGALERSPLIRDHAPALFEAEHHVGNVRVRSQGTLGGNLCFADPHSDPGTALLVHDATVTVEGTAGARQLALDAFFVGTYATALEAGELLTQVQVPPLAQGWGSAFLRIERFYRPTANVAAAAVRADGRLGEVRLAVGCVGPRATRLRDLEARLRGLSLEEARRVIGESKPQLTEVLDPVSDLLGSAEYKIHITAVLLGRALEQAVGMAAG